MSLRREFRRQPQNVSTATDQNFDCDVLKANQLCLVDFWSEWYGPYKMIASTIDAVTDEIVGKLKVFRINFDENSNTPTQFQIRWIPTLLLFKNGQMVDQLVGNQPKEVIAKTIQRHLAQSLLLLRLKLKDLNDSCYSVFTI